VGQKEEGMERPQGHYWQSGSLFIAADRWMFPARWIPVRLQRPIELTGRRVPG